MQDAKKIISEYLDYFSSLDKTEAIIRKNKAAGLIYPHTEFYINFGEAIDAALQEIEALKKEPSKKVKTVLQEWKDILVKSNLLLHQRSMLNTCLNNHKKFGIYSRETDIAAYIRWAYSVYA